MSAFKQKFVQKQLQTLSLSYGMKLSLELLQLNALQLKEYLEKELLDNPMFEVDMPSDMSYQTKDEQWDIADSGISLEEELLFQIQDEKINLALLEGILHNCDRNGYLQVTPQELAASFHTTLKEIMYTLQCIHGCVPYGIGAQNLKECLMIQLEHQYPEDTLAMQIVQHHLEDIAKNHMEKIAQACHVSQTQVKEAVQRIQTLNPRPGAAYDLESAVFVKADIILEREDDNIRIIMPHYMTIREVDYYKGYAGTNEEKEFMKEKQAQGKAIMECLQHRQKTLHDIMQVMVNTQKRYLLHEGSLSCLRMREIGEELSMHETTISRAMKDKYYEYEGQVLPLRTLLCRQLHDTSVDDVVGMIQNMIEEEDHHAPLSDQNIADALKKMNVTCSRRTIAKYRMERHIPSAQTRRRLKEK